MNGFFSRGQAGLRILCALVLVVAGLSHRPVLASSTDVVTGYAYMLPDGSVPDICLVDDDGSQPGNHVDRPCEACVIASGAMLPDVDLASVEVIRLASAASFILRPEAGQRLLVPPGARPRGPPLFLADV